MVADWMPGARSEQVRNTSGTMGNSIGLVLHVQEGNGDLQGWFNDPSAQASAHFQVRKDGSINQFLRMNQKSWAQSSGNSYWHSVETEGFATEPLTDAQINGVARIFSFGGWRHQLSETPSTPGLGWHGMGGQSWGGHFGCPGDLRKAQRAEILRRAGGITPPSHDPNHRFDGYPTLRNGSTDGNSNGKVSVLQKGLNDVGTFHPAMSVDGGFGPTTEKWVRQFQSDMRLTSDGVVGGVTWGSLGALLTKYGK